MKILRVVLMSLCLSDMAAFAPLLPTRTTPWLRGVVRMATPMAEEDTLSNNNGVVLKTDVTPLAEEDTVSNGVILKTDVSPKTPSKPVQVSAFDAFAAMSLGGANPEYQRGLITIGAITFLFASNSPALHAVFTESSPPPVLLVNAAISGIALVGLLSGGSVLESSTPLPSSLTEEEGASVRAGLELGLWKFLGTTANLAGLSMTTADHGAFLIQLTTLIVPVVQGIMGVPIPRRIQTAVVLALFGVFLFTQDVSESATQASTMGDSLCVVAAGFYATYDLRLFSWGKKVSPRKLITGKIATQAVLSLLLLAACGYQDSVDYLTAASPRLEIVIPVILWSGVAVNAVAPFLQVGGQQAVGPTRCQTIYASQPLWASIMSYVFLGETVGSQGLVGGAAFLVALFLAATAEAPDPDCGKDMCEV
jgi:drug/metabolite transporter (DMT)-like permease